MKNPRAVMMVLISVVIGIAAVAIAAKWLADQGKLSTSKVVVATKDLEIGSRLRPDMLEVVDWPLNAVVKGAFKESKPLLEEGKERVVNTQVLRGEPITEAKLAPVGEKGGLSAVLKAGNRAITVRVNEVVGVAGFALPGNYVDILVNTQDAKNQPISKIVLEHIPVLAVAQDLSQGDAKPRVVNAVTLEVTPQQAEALDLARSIGQLSLVLRAQSDVDSARTAGVRKDDLMHFVSAQPESKTDVSGSAGAPVKVAATRRPVKQVAKAGAGTQPPVDKVEVIRGTTRTIEQPAALAP